MKYRLFIFTVLFFAAGLVFAQDFFEQSLHATRIGKETWYKSANGGFEMFTGIPISELGCMECHAKTDADGVENGKEYKASCVDCHPTGSDFNPEKINIETCYSCHGRQEMEAKKLKYPDVHRDAGMVCWDCHTVADMHGTAVEKESMLDEGGISAKCEDCHEELPEAHVKSDPHNGKLSCSSCHSKSVISCYNCHFESMTEAHLKRAKQPIKDFVILVNRKSDGKVHTASFQSVSYHGKGFVAIGPYTSHTIVKEGRKCVDCHQNKGGDIPAIKQYNENGKIQFSSWDEENKKLNWLKGVVPLPADYQKTFKMDFITYDGNPADPLKPSNNWSKVTGDWDGHQLFYAAPLTYDQMRKLGFKVEVPKYNSH